MSAYFVGFDHINAMLSIVDDREGILLPASINNGRTVWSRPEKAQWDALGLMLAKENENSLRARYEDYASMLPNQRETAAWRYRHDGYAVCNLSLADKLGLADCYEYQSCEHEGWTNSEAFIWLQAYRKQVLRRLPGRSDAVWNYTGASDHRSAVLRKLEARRAALNEPATVAPNWD